MLEEMGALGAMRRGSLSERVRPCGKPNCHCKQPGNPGHGPTYSLTYKVGGKTQMETIPAHRVPAIRQQLENRKRFAELSQRFLEINEELCRQESVEKNAVEASGKKNSGKRSKKRSPRNSRAS
jgi:hypothetical protein